MLVSVTSIKFGDVKAST